MAKRSIEERLTQIKRAQIALNLETAKEQLKAGNDVGALSVLTAALAELKALASRPEK